MNKIRLQVFLSRNSTVSRRKAMDLIFAGQVTVNGKKILEPSMAVDPTTDIIAVNGRDIKTKVCDYILLNKPVGYVTTKAYQFFQKTVFELLPKEFQHLSTAGRLDQDTEGLLLFTNDGDVAYKLTHPKFDIEKTYSVRIKKKLDEKEKRKIEQGIVIENKKTAPAKVCQVKEKKHFTEFTLTIHEGRKRQIRLMLAKVGHRVIYLKRLNQGPLSLGHLETGKWRALTQQEISHLKKL